MKQNPGGHRVSGVLLWVYEIKVHKLKVNRGVIVTKFEQVGINLQNDAKSKEDAVRSFSYSCRVCCERGMRLSCDRCAIAVTHASTVAAFDSLHAMKKRGESGV